MLNLTNEEVVLTTDDLVAVQLSKCVNGKASIMLRFKGDANEYKKDNWVEWQGAIRKNSVEPPEQERILVTDEALIFPTGTFKNPLKAQIGCNGTYNPATRTVILDGALVRLYFDTSESFENVKQAIEQSAFFQFFGVPTVTGNLAWTYVHYVRG